MIEDVLASDAVQSAPVICQALAEDCPRYWGEKLPALHIVGARPPIDEETGRPW
jgi:hypothetical protein